MEIWEWQCFEEIPLDTQKCILTHTDSLSITVLVREVAWSWSDFKLIWVAASVYVMFLNIGIIILA